MKIKEYYKAQYNLRGIEENSKNFELVTLEKLYGKKLNIYDWYDNLKTDCDEDGGVDFIVINLDEHIIPLIDNEFFSELFYDAIDNNLNIKEIESITRKIFDDSGEVIQADLIDIIIKKISNGTSKLKIDFIQSKSGNSLQEKVFLKLNSTFDDLLVNEKYESRKYSKKLKDNIKFIKELIKQVSINNGAVEVNVLYIASDESTPKSITHHIESAETIKDKIIDGIKHNNVNFHLLYGQKLIDRLDFNDNRNLYFNVSNSDIMMKNNLFFVALIKLKEIERFVTLRDDTIDFSLFDGNVRDCYKTSSSINKQIIETLKSDIKTNDFWWLNNGITIICDSATRKLGKINLINPQIVNGLQSVVTIYDTLKSGIRKNENKKIMVKVLVEKNQENINTIIKATNTQNPVDDYLLMSTKPIHRDIENYFLSNGEGYFYDRRKNYYKNMSKDKKKIFDIKYTFKTYASIFLGIPSQVRTSTKKNFNDKHNDVFNNGINKTAYLYSNILDRKIQETLKKTDIDVEFKEKNGVSIVTYSLHIAYIYTVFLKNTMDFSDKYISHTDIKTVLEIDLLDENLNKSIEFINKIIGEFPSENKVYLARMESFEKSIKDALSEILK